MKKTLLVLVILMMVTSGAFAGSLMDELKKHIGDEVTALIIDTGGENYSGTLIDVNDDIVIIISERTKFKFVIKTNSITGFYVTKFNN